MNHKSVLPPTSTLRDARMVRTRDALQAALLTLLKRHSFDQLTIRDITAEAGIGYATFFRHYETKSALLNDVAAEQIARLIKLALPILYEIDSRAAASVLCRYVDGRRRLWSALLSGGAAGTMREEFLRQARRISPLKTPGARRTWLPDDLRIIYGVCSTVEILAWWLQTRKEFTVEQVAEILDRLVIAPAMKAE